MVTTTTLIVLIGTAYILGPEQFSTREDCDKAASLATQTVKGESVTAICFDVLGQVVNRRDRG